LVQYCRELFAIADTNHDGVLQPDEFRILMQSTGFGLSDPAIERMLEQGDLNGDGVIEPGEFLPIMLAIMRQDQV